MNLIEKGIVFATKAHEGQYRKLSNTPYIIHPLEVATIIATITEDENVIVAGLLHDVIEECNITSDVIKNEFNSRVSALVQSESEDKLNDRSKSDSWLDRKEESLLMLEHTKDRDVKILWLADKLSNMRSFYREYLKNGHEFLNHLNQKDIKMHYWYYSSVAKYTSELKDTAAYQEYVDLVEKVFKGD